MSNRKGYFTVMIESINIKNFKSIQSLNVDIGRFNVIIGENGSGKTNILEAIAMASAASQNKLDHEFLASRGIRVTEPQLMRSGFDIKNVSDSIKIYISQSKDNYGFYVLVNQNKKFSKWEDELVRLGQEFLKSFFCPIIIKLT